MSWSLAAAGVLACALLLTPARSGMPSLVLLLAPVAPLPAVAASWSRRLDPAWELIGGTPGAGLMMLLRRTAAALAVLTPMLALCGLVAGDGGRAMAMAVTLLPSLGCTAATIAIGGRFGVGRAAAAVGGLWAGIVIVPSVRTQTLSAALTPGAVPAWVVATLVLVAYALIRTDDYRRLASRS